MDSLVIGLAKCSSWSRPSPVIYAFFFLFQNKTINLSRLFRKRVIAIGLTPSRTGFVIGPSRTGFVIGRLLNAQLRHECALRGGINYLYFGHRHAVGQLHNTVWFYKVRWSFPSHFPSLLNTLLMHFAFTFISGQFLIYNLQRHILCNKHGTLINKTNKYTITML